GDPWKIFSFGLYGSTLVILYAVATLYHAQRGRVKRLLRELDHCAVFLLIAGTYTPFSLVTLRGEWGWTLFGLAWGAALYGIALVHWPSRMPQVPELGIYLGMGWLILLAIRPLLHTLSWPGLAWLAIGGFFYTGGVAFFVLDERYSWAHGCWHLCVLAGSLSHFLAVFLYIA
ncbi:MAG TPA: hemolysin III family protein, partial [Geobacteraceae bacterium]|nr:hemolysin III family protein [Geobacteraceae bacterium]